MTQMAGSPGGGPQQSEVTIGIVAALWIEGLAMKSLIGDVIALPPIPADPNHYHIGRLASSQPDQQHSIVLTTMPRDSTRNAAAICTNLIRSFPKVRCVIMMGIAGGVPAYAAPDRHVRLGDIVVATEGVVDWSHVRRVNGRATPRRHVEGLSGEMARAALELRADEFQKRPRWAPLLDLTATRDLSQFARPKGPNADVLRIRGERARHPDRRLTHHPAGLPKVHYGAIATGDVLLRDEVKRDELGTDYGVLAVEMEASGIAAGTGMLNKQWFMVRGIADYCDDATKSDLWHPYSSLAAAAYVRALLAACHPFEVAAEQPKRNNVRRPRPPEERGVQLDERCRAAVQEMIKHPFWSNLANRRSFANVLRTKVPINPPISAEKDPETYLTALLAEVVRKPRGLVDVLGALSAMPESAQVEAAAEILSGLTVRDLLPGKAAEKLTRILAALSAVNMAELVPVSHPDTPGQAIGVATSPRAAFDAVMTASAHPDNVSTLLAMIDRLIEARAGDDTRPDLLGWRVQVVSHLGFDGEAVWRPLRPAASGGTSSSTESNTSDVRAVPPSTQGTQEVAHNMANMHSVREAQVSTPVSTHPSRADPGDHAPVVRGLVLPEPGVTPPVWGNVPPRNPHFTGRRALLEDLAERLRTADLAAVLPQAIHGMGGVGKSQLAIEYVYRYLNEYNVIWWIPAERPQQILAAMAELARDLDLPVGPEANTAVPAVREALRKGQPYDKWLLVFDNAEDLDAVRSVVPTGGPGKILVTSRNADWSLESDTLEVDVFDRPESVRLLQRRDPNITDRDAQLLAEALGDLPLAIEQAASWLAATGMSAGEYLELLQSRVELLEATGSQVSDRSVAAAWTMSLDRLEETSPAAMQLLEICAFFAPEPITRALFSNVRTAGSEDTPDDLDLALRDPIKLNKAFRDIQRYALARINHRTSTIELHRLVQAVVRSRVPQERQSEVRHRGHRLLAAADPREPDTIAHWERYQALISHVLASGAVTCDDPWVRDLVFDIVKYLYRWGDHEGCERLARDVFNAWTEILGPNSPETLKVAKYYGYILWINGKFTDASKIGEEALRIYESNFEAGDEDVIDAKLQFARDLHTAGHFERAVAVVREALVEARRSLGGEDPKTLYASHQLGVSLRLAGQFEEAGEIDTETLRLRTDVLGADDFETLQTFNGLTIDQRERGEYNHACQSQERVFARHQLLFGENNPATTRAGRNLAVARRKAGDHAGALSLSREMEKRFRERYGGRYPDAVASAMNLAVDLRQNKDLGGSKERGADTLRIYEELLGEKHPFTMSARTNQAITLRLLGELQKALDFDQIAVEGLRETIGEDHPLSMIAATNLASDHYALGEYQIAFELDTDTLDRSRRVNGEDHPSTLAVNANLALDLRALGRVGEADAMHQDVVARYRRVLGDGHPATVNASRHIRSDCDVDPMPI